MEGIIAALVTGGLSLIGVIVTCLITNRHTKDEITAEFRISQAVMQTEIKELTREVREHNNFARRMPVAESDIEHLKEEVHELQSYHIHK